MAEEKCSRAERELTQWTDEFRKLRAENNSLHEEKNSESGQMPYLAQLKKDNAILVGLIDRTKP